MIKYLVIVESPAKAKTIAGYLGEEFVVVSSYGHVRDLAESDLSVDVDNGFAPHYEIPPDKKQVVAELRKLAAQAETVWLATDEDREGEAISWHLKETLELQDATTNRITFHEITKPAILAAIANPRPINTNLVMAQQARRVLDRLVGFELSPVLWRKIKPSLSAGRVQSVAARMVVDRERAIEAFQPTASFRVIASCLSPGDKPFKAELTRRIESVSTTRSVLESCRNARYVVSTVETKPAKRSPSPPFTTSTLQQEASRKLGFSVNQTMVVAQKLYEAGFITYMRTDSLNLSTTAAETISDTVKTTYGPDYAFPRSFQTKTLGAQEAHEAIRPTEPARTTVEGDSGMIRLYDLIRKRTLASQMADARLEKTTARLSVSTNDEVFVAQGEALLFDGFLRVYQESVDEEPDEENTALLPKMTAGDVVTVQNITATERFTHPPPRFTEASLVRALEEQGIGRPSTYAPTISTIQRRNYARKQDRPGKERICRSLILTGENLSETTLTETVGTEKARLFPTDIGLIVNDFLVQHFNTVVDYGFTAVVEKEFDDIAEGLLTWNAMMAEFYQTFHAAVTHTLDTSERASGERLLGVDPVSGQNVTARMGRFGPVVQIGTTDSPEKPRFASIGENQSLGTITLEEGLALFQFPRTLGEHEGKPVTVATGRYGPYVRHNEVSASLDPKSDDPLTVSLTRALELIAARKETEAGRVIQTFPGKEQVRILNGRYGPYIAIGRKNVRIPKDRSPESLTLEECLALAAEAPARKTRRSSSRKP